MRVLDLFCGCGGMSLALNNVATSSAGYCDIDPRCLESIKRNIAKKLIHSGPLFNDVRAIHGKDLQPPPQLITASFPCVGFSTLGLGAGFDNPHTHLFFEVLRIVDGIKPTPIVVFENVPGVLKDEAMKVVVRELCERRGFDISWMVVPAYIVKGALHSRKRWFCVAVPPKTDVPKLHEPKPHQNRPEPPRMVIGGTLAEDIWRFKAMGNAVVPPCAGLALSLVSGFDRTPKVFTTVPTSGDWPTSGVVTARGKRLSHGASMPPLYPPKLSLVVDPSLYTPKKTIKCNTKNDVLTTPIHRTSWASPMHGTYCPTHQMTERSAHNLPTQVRFEKGTVNRRGHINPEWVEWLMLCPSGWTNKA